MATDRDWMYDRVADGYVREEFRHGVVKFLDFAYSQCGYVERDGKIICPCSKCRLLKKQARDEVHVHLYRHGFVEDYKCWVKHGETFSYSRSTTIASSSNPMIDMVMDIGGPQAEEEPTGESEEFYDLLKKAEEPLWYGCKTYTKLSAISELLAFKIENNITDKAFDILLGKIKKMLPEDHELPKNYYETKKMMRKLGMAEEKIDACVNNCIIYYGEHANLTECPECHHSRYKEHSKTNVSNKVLRYFPLAPRLKRLYYCRETAKDMTWHSTHAKTQFTEHPSDSECWRRLNESFPSFAAEKRNVIVGLSSDGFNPHGRGKDYSCWPVMVSPYNLPPGLCNKRQYIFLTLLIPGPTHPGKHIDVFLRPLIDELKMLWESGVQTYDAYLRQTFTMRVALLWTINDFPAYGMLSGWSTHGRLSCPYCMEHTKSFQLEHGRKTCFFDCHRQFLPEDHPYRGQRYSFKKNTFESSRPPPRRTGDELWNQLMKFEQITFGTTSGTQVFEGFGRTHNWTKRSIF